MKKIVNISLCLILLSFSLLVLFSSCEEHVHAFGEWSTVLEPTCAAEGRQERVCECGEKEEAPIEALPHTAGKWENEVIATVLNKGIQSSYCTVCQEPLIRELPQKVTKYLTYTVNADGVTCTITGRKMGGTIELGIPEEIDGYKVTAIAEKAFEYNMYNIRYIYIPEGVTHIGARAFATIFYEKIHLPNSLVYIGEDAIEYSSFGDYTRYDNALYIGNEANPYILLIRSQQNGATRCNVNPNTKFIAKEAFKWCPELTSVTIPDSVVDIDEHTFINCTGLTSVKLSKNMKEIPEGMFIGCTNLSVLELPSGIRKIGKNAFHGCKNLKHIEFGDELEIIEDSAFSGCEDLSFIRLPNSLRTIGEGAFAGCKSLYEVVIPEGVETIETNAFARCSALKAVLLPEGLKSIKQNAFISCTSLEALILPDTLEELGINAFHETDKLTLNEYENGYYLGSVNNPYLIFMERNTKLSTTFKLHKDTKFIYDGAFKDYTHLREIELPQGLLHIGSDAFSGCVALSEITFPESLRYIGNAAFSGCERLLSVTLGKNVEYVGEIAFRGCKSLKHVVISGSKTEIAWGAFYADKEIKQLVINEGVEIIGKYAFYDCENLETVTLPSTIKKLDDFSFAYTRWLNDIIYNGTTEQWNNITKSENWDWRAGTNLYYLIRCANGFIEHKM